MVAPSLASVKFTEPWTTGSVMVVDVTWQVVSRFVLRSPSSFTEEMAGSLLIWIGLLGAAYGIRTRAHLGIDILVEQLEGRWRRGAEAFAHFLVLLFAFTTMVGGGIWLVRLAFRLDQISAALGLPMWIVYLALPLSGLVVTWQGVFGIKTSYAWRQTHLITTFVTLGAALPHLREHSARPLPGGALARLQGETRS